MISQREFLMAVARRLLQVRLAYDKSQKEMGETLGVKNSAISNYEAGSRAVDPYAALKLKTDLGVPLEWLYAGDESTLAPHMVVKLAEGARKASEPTKPRKAASHPKKSTSRTVKPKPKKVGRRQ